MSKDKKGNEGKTGALKDLARIIKKREGISHAEALERAARESGYSSWHEASRVLGGRDPSGERASSTAAPTPPLWRRHPLAAYVAAEAAWHASAAGDGYSGVIYGRREDGVLLGEDGGEALVQLTGPKAGAAGVRFFRVDLARLRRGSAMEIWAEMMAARECGGGGQDSEKELSGGSRARVAGGQTRRRTYAEVATEALVAGLPPGYVGSETSPIAREGEAPEQEEVGRVRDHALSPAVREALRSLREGLRWLRARGLSGERDQARERPRTAASDLTGTRLRTHWDYESALRVTSAAVHAATGDVPVFVFDRAERLGEVAYGGRESRNGESFQSTPGEAFAEAGAALGAMIEIISVGFVFVCRTEGGENDVPNLLSVGEAGRALWGAEWLHWTPEGPEKKKAPRW